MRDIVIPKLKNAVAKLEDLFIQFKKNTLEIANIIYETRKDKEIYNVKEGDKLKDYLTTNKIMSETAYSCFLSIGKAQYLQKPEMIEYIPLHQQSLYLISKDIQVSDLQTLIKQKKITPTTTIAELTDIINNLKNTKKNTSKKPTRLFTISISYDDFKKHKGEIKTIKAKIEQLFPYLKITN